MSASRRMTLSGLPESAEPLALSRLLRGEFPPLPPAKSILHVCVNDRALDALAQALPFFAPGVEILRLPAWDVIPYDRVSPRAALAAERLETLSALASAPDKPRIVLTTAAAAVQKLPLKSIMARASFALKPGAVVSRDALLRFLEENGYRRAGKAIEPGEYALRGGILDVIPAGNAEGLRLDFFGDEIESIRVFDPLTQVSAGESEGATLKPVSEALLTPETVQRFRARYRELFGAVNKDDPLYEAVSASQRFPGMEHWLPLFYDSLDTVFDYAPNALVTFSAESEDAVAERQETVADHYGARSAMQSARRQETPYHPVPPEMLFLMHGQWEKALAERDALFFSPLADETSAVAARIRPPVNLAVLRHGNENPFAQLRAHAEEKRGQGKSTLLACLSVGSAERLRGLLIENGVHAVKVERFAEIKSVSGKAIGVAALPLASGFETESLAAVSEQDLLGERILRSVRKKKTPEQFLAEAANFSEGDLVVHREHGIARYEGLETIEVQGARHDCLKLSYADDDRLYLPVENADLLSRYGAEAEGVKRDKLGAAAWQARTSRLKERIKLAAEALLKTAAERALKTAPVLAAPPEAYDAFIARFPYVETDDQQRAIDDVMSDLESGHPMDRLICGDVGFGKTEVALRAAFTAAQPPLTDDGGRRTHAPSAAGREPPADSAGRYQVALIAPTTLLARQHYANFKERFEGFGVKVAQLSRMVPAVEQNKVREGLESGEIGIVIGTHALLSKSVKFKRLGLLIVDEEQHFGVAQKEKLKSLKSDLHVLTLSATPIPRTMQMALSGVRSLSLIATPPVDRLAVRSFVSPWDALTLREALLREKHRGGRSFVVTPRIRDMGELKAKLVEIAPEIRIALAHGDMTPAALDTVMNEFFDGKFDALLSTAIIESGLDIPNANTLIVNRADRFGLSQLYQLRGRVGRGKLRAYAYFLLPPRRTLTPEATRRLEVMQSLDALGAGFTVASHDMDIRGFGNLVGEEQSGHIKEVGIELYQQMLEEAVAALKAADGGQQTDDAPAAGRPPPADWSPQLNLGLSVLIPEEYVSDLSLRLGLYRRAAGLSEREEIESFAAELIDRFGPLPPEAEAFLETMRLKLLCRKAGIARIDAGPKGAVISFHEDKFAQPQALLSYLSRRPTMLKLRPDQKLVLMAEWKTEEEKIASVRKLLEEISGLI